MKRYTTLILSLALIGCGELEGDPQGDLAEDETADDVEVKVSALSFTERCNRIATRRTNDASLNFLGSPVGACNSHTGGASINYLNGTMYFGDTVGNPFELHGLILSRYVALGGPASALKFPTTDERSTYNNTGRFNGFEKGDILWKTGASAAWEVHGCEHSKWGSVGWETSLLGFPTSNEIAWTEVTGQFPALVYTNWKRNEFEYGTVYLRNDWGGSCANRTFPVLSAWNSGAAYAQIGYPTIAGSYFDATGGHREARVRVTGSGFTPGQTVRAFTTTPRAKCAVATGTVSTGGTFNISSAQLMSSTCLAKVNGHVSVEAYDDSGRGGVTRFSYPF
jgi:LGFP repeat